MEVRTEKNSDGISRLEIWRMEQGKFVSLEHLKKIKQEENGEVHNGVWKD